MCVAVAARVRVLESELSFLSTRKHEEGAKLHTKVRNMCVCVCVCVYMCVRVYL
jgi:hypothetical protein